MTVKDPADLEMTYALMDGDVKITCSICYNSLARSSFHRHLKCHDLQGAGEGSEVKDYQFVYWGNADHLRVLIDFQSFLLNINDLNN